jgi:hypothetical protein
LHLKHCRRKARLAHYQTFQRRSTAANCDEGMVYSLRKAMIFSKDYVGYLARQTVKHLVAAKAIESAKLAVLNERVATAMVEELSLEDRINDEVRVILEAFQDDMRKTGASYPEMFKKVKNELARKYKAVL